MDTSKLVEGQKVWMRSWKWLRELHPVQRGWWRELKEGKVIRITEKSVTVEIAYDNLRVFIPFDKTGKQPEGNDPDFEIIAYGVDGYLCPRPFCGRWGGIPFELIDKPEEEDEDGFVYGLENIG
jgi:hypothetical protein